MKLLIAITAVVFTLTSFCAAVTPAEESRFLETLRGAFLERNKAAIIDLICWDHATEKDRQAGSDFVDNMLSQPMESANYLLLGSVKLPSHIKDGVFYGPNLVITHEIEIKYGDVPGLPSRESESFYCGEKGGKLMIIVLTPRS